MSIGIGIGSRKFHSPDGTGTGASVSSSKELPTDPSDGFLTIEGHSFFRPFGVSRRIEANLENELISCPDGHRIIVYRCDNQQGDNLQALAELMKTRKVSLWEGKLKIDSREFDLREGQFFRFEIVPFAQKAKESVAKGEQPIGKLLASATSSRAQIGQDETVTVNLSGMARRTLNRVLDLTTLRFAHVCRAISRDLSDIDSLIAAHNDQRLLEEFKLDEPFEGGNILTRIISHARIVSSDLVREFKPNIRIILKKQNKEPREIFNLNTAGSDVTELTRFEIDQDPAKNSNHIAIQNADGSSRIFAQNLDFGRDELQVLVEYPNMPEGIKTEKFNAIS